MHSCACWMQGSTLTTARCLFRYDSHRDAILRSGETHQAGGDGGVTPGQRPTDELDPFKYFSTSCYSGYNDGAKVQHIKSPNSQNMQNTVQLNSKGQFIQFAATAVLPCRRLSQQIDSTLLVASDCISVQHKPLSPTAWCQACVMHMCIAGLLYCLQHCLPKVG